MSLENLDKPNYGWVIKLLLFGLVIWAIPFALSFFLYTPEGLPLLSEGLFNSIMSVILVIVTVMVTKNYFKNTSERFIKEGIVIGFSWLIISLVLDYFVLIPLSNLQIETYITNIAIGYIVIPIITIFAGLLLNNHITNNRMIISKIAGEKTRN